MNHWSSRRDDRGSLLDIVAISSSIESVRFLLLCSSRRLFLLLPHFFRFRPENILPLDDARRAAIGSVENDKDKVECERGRRNENEPIIVSDVDRLFLRHVRNEEDIIRSSVRDLHTDSISLFERFEFRVEFGGFATLFLQFPILLNKVHLESSMKCSAATGVEGEVN